MSNQPYGKKHKAMLTPKGALFFPKLNAPDEYKGKTFYNADIILDPEDAAVQKYLAKLEAIRDQYVKELKAWCAKQKGKTKALGAQIHPRETVYDVHYDKDGEETGMIILRARMNATYEKDGKVKKMSPKFFDAAGKKVGQAPEIWGGSIVRIGADVAATKNPQTHAIGVNHYLDAVFLIDVKNGGGRDASDYGFDGEEGGYTHDGSDDNEDASYDMDDDVDTDADDNPDF